LIGDTPDGNMLAGCLSGPNGGRPRRRPPGHRQARLDPGGDRGRDERQRPEGPPPAVAGPWWMADPRPAPLHPRPARTAADRPGPSAPPPSL